MILSEMVLLILACSIFVESQPYASHTFWRGKDVKVEVSPSEYVGEKRVDAYIRDNIQTKKIALEDHLEDVGKVYLMKSKCVEIVFQAGRSIYWYRLTPNWKIKPMQGLWETDCIIMATGKNSLLIASHPLCTDDSFYFRYDASKQSWERFVGAKEKH